MDHINSERAKGLAEDLISILEKSKSLEENQYAAYAKAIEEIKEVKDLLSDPEHILGSLKTKHGEIAEFLQVYITRASDIVNQLPPAATFDGVGRTAPADYTINGIAVQSKFINGMNNTLSAVLDHMGNYENFGRDSSYYQIPKDQYEMIETLMNGGQVDGLNLNSQTAILKKVSEIELNTGHSFADVVKPGISAYREVQQGVVFKTVDGHEQAITDINGTRIDAIHEGAEQAKKETIEGHNPSMAEAGKVAAVGAGIAGVLSFGMGIRRKIREGKKLQAFTLDDWKELGVDTAYASMKGGVTGASIYGLTNYANMAAPVAAAYISASFGIANLYNQYKKEEIQAKQFYEESHLVCVDSSIVALGAVAGSMFIPIPVLGALVGSLIARTAEDHLKEILSEKEQKEICRMNYNYQKYIKGLDEKSQEVIAGIIKKYDKMNGMTGIAFNYEANSFFRFNGSIELARILKIPDVSIIRNKPGLNKYLGRN